MKNRKAVKAIAAILLSILLSISLVLLFEKIKGMKNHEYVSPRVVKSFF
jgi:hypothetical protein